MDYPLLVKRQIVLKINQIQIHEALCIHTYRISGKIEKWCKNAEIKNQNVIESACNITLRGIEMTQLTRCWATQFSDQPSGFWLSHKYRPLWILALPVS